MVLDEESGHIYMTSFGRQMQRSRPVPALSCCVRAVLDEEPGKTQITLEGCPMQLKSSRPRSGLSRWCRAR